MLPTMYGSFFKRLVAYVIDVIISSAVAGIVVIPLALLTLGTGALAGLSMHSFSFGRHADPEIVVRTLLDTIPVALILFWIVVHKLLGWFYFAVFESSPRQATPGKMMFGLFVTDVYGRRISFPRALGRTVGKVLSKMFCWMGYIIALFTARSQALHDMLASTLVLEPAYPAPYADNSPPPATPPAQQSSRPGPEGAALPQEPTAEGQEPPLVDLDEKKSDETAEDSPPPDDKPDKENE